MTKDINKGEFDEATKTKLELVKRYLTTWLAIFFVKNTEKIEIYDFFAGSGTDFLFFIPSSFIKRFAEQLEFKQYLISEKIDFDDTKFSHSHRVIFNYYKSLIPTGKKYFLGQFSIKKNSNYYGLIFGSNHPKGLEKFIESAWKIDPYTGESNYDIDDDPIREGNISIFSEYNQPKKLTLYEHHLLDWMADKGKSNIEIYLYSLENGIAKSKTREILQNLEKDGKILIFNVSKTKRRKGSFYLNYDPDHEILITKK